MVVPREDYFGLFFPVMSEITEKGIKCKNKYYSCQMAIRKQWFHLMGSNRVQLVFVDPLNDDYLLIPLEDGCLAVAYEIEHYQVDAEKKNDYYKLINRFKTLIKNRKRKKS
jgi:hypothetical protein